MATAGENVFGPIKMGLALAAILTVLLGFGALAWLIWRSWRSPAEDRLKPEGTCFVCYLLALAFLVIAWLAPPCVVGSYGLGPMLQRKVLLVAGLVVAALGGVLHVLLARLGMLADSRERRGWLGLLVAAAPGLALLAFIDRHYGGRGLRLLVGAVGLASVVLLALYVGAQGLQFRALPENRMARLMNGARWAEAAVIGESVPAEKRSPLAQWNLAVCYDALGRPQEADALWEALQVRLDLPEFILPHLEQKLASRRGLDAAPRTPITGDE